MKNFIYSFGALAFFVLLSCILERLQMWRGGCGMDTLRETREKVQKAGFWCVVIFVLGMIIGGFGAKVYYTARASEAAKLGGVIINGFVYDVKKRVYQGE